MHRVYILILSVCLSSCRYSGHLKDLEQQLDRSILNQKEQDTLRITLDTITSFDWDELIMAGPYTYLENIEGYDLSRFPETLKHHDRFILIGFIKEKVGIKWVFIKRYLLLDEISNKDSQGYQIYKKGNCNFEILNHSSLEKQALEREDFDKAQIFSKVIDTIAAEISPRSLWPVPPPNKDGINTLTKEDSLEHREAMLKFINFHRTIAIDTSLVIYIPEFNLSEKMLLTNDFFAINKAYDSLSTHLNIDLDKIELRKAANSIYFDSITYLNPEKHIKKDKRGRSYGTYVGGVSYRFNFSKIVYNKDKTKAAVRCFYRFEDRYPHNTMFLLEKQNNEWEVKRSKFFMGY